MIAVLGEARPGGPHRRDRSDRRGDAQRRDARRLLSKPLRWPRSQPTHHTMMTGREFGMDTRKQRRPATARPWSRCWSSWPPPARVHRRPLADARASVGDVGADRRCDTAHPRQRAGCVRRCPDVPDGSDPPGRPARSRARRPATAHLVGQGRRSDDQPDPGRRHSVRRQRRRPPVCLRCPDGR